MWLDKWNESAEKNQTHTKDANAMNNNDDEQKTMQQHLNKRKIGKS